MGIRQRARAFWVACRASGATQTIEPHRPQLLQNQQSWFFREVRVFHLTLVLLAILLLLVAQGLHHFNDRDVFGFLWSRETYVDLVKELGFALLIAFAISVTIEVAARREHRRELQDHMAMVNRNVFGAIYGVFLPRPLVDEAVKVIFGPKFVRHNYQLRYDLSIERRQVPSGRDVSLVVIEGCVSYRVRNVTPSPQQFSVVWEIEEPPLSPSLPADSINAVYIDGRSISVAADLSLQRAPSVAGYSITNHAKFSHKVTVPADGELEVVMYNTMYRDMDDNEFAYSATPSEDMSLCVVLPPDIKTFGALALHDRDLLLASEVPERRQYEWRISGPVLPYQGIYFWWRRDDPSVALTRAEDAGSGPQPIVPGPHTEPQPDGQEAVKVG